MFSVPIFLWIHRPSPKEHLQMSQYVPLPRWSPGALRRRPSRHPVFALSQGPDVAARPVPGPKSQRKMLGLRGQKPIGKQWKIWEPPLQMEVHGWEYHPWMVDFSCNFPNVEVTLTKLLVSPWFSHYGSHKPSMYEFGIPHPYPIL